MAGRAVRSPRGVRRILTLGAMLLSATLALAAAADATPGPADGGDRHPHLAQVSPTGTSERQLAPLRGPVTWGVPQPACAAPKEGRASCFAIRWKPATADTPGAVPYAGPAVGAGPGGGYTPAQLAKAYGYDPAGSAGATQTVAVVDAYDDPYARAELNVFNAQYGLPPETATSFRKVNQQGATSPLPAADSGWAGEIALDIQAVRPVCRRCRILLVEADSAGTADLADAVDTAARLGATEISNSYGGPEVDDEPAYVLAAYDHP